VAPRRKRMADVPPYPMERQLRELKKLCSDLIADAEGEVWEPCAGDHLLAMIEQFKEKFDRITVGDEPKEE